jgi:hypothetical protein
MVNMDEMLRASLADDAGSVIARSLSAPEGETRLAIAAAIPVMLGAIAQRGGSTIGADRVLGMLRAGSLERVSPDAVGARVGSETDRERMLAQGTGLLGALFEGKVGALAEGVAAVSGLSSATTPRLLGLVASLVLGLLKDHVVENRIGANDFVAMMSAQRPTLLGAIDRRLLGALGYSSVAAYLDSDNQPSISRPVLPSIMAEPTDDRPLLYRLIPWLLLVIAVLVLVLVVLRGRGA